MTNSSNPTVQWEINCSDQTYIFKVELFKHKAPMFVESFMQYIRGKEVQGRLMKLNIVLDDISGSCIYCKQGGEDPEHFLRSFYDQSYKWEERTDQTFKQGHLIAYENSFSSKEQDAFMIISDDYESNYSKYLTFGRIIEGIKHLNVITDILREQDPATEEQKITTVKMETITQGREIDDEKDLNGSTVELKSEEYVNLEK